MSAYPVPVVVKVPLLPAVKVRRRRLARGSGPLYKVVCSDLVALRSWAFRHRQSGVRPEWIHRSRSGVWHIDLWGEPAEKLGLR